MESIEMLRKDADVCTQTAGVENEFETVWITKSVLLKDIEDIEREVEERYIELPKDADGKPIHVGDRLCGWALEGKPVITVHHITSYEDGWRVSDKPAHEGTPNLYRHYKPPTVEDVLNELCTKAFHSREMGSNGSYRDVIAEYTAKLQLKEVE